MHFHDPAQNYSETILKIDEESLYTSHINPEALSDIQKRQIQELSLNLIDKLDEYYFRVSVHPQPIEFRTVKRVLNQRDDELNFHYKNNSQTFYESIGLQRNYGVKVTQTIGDMVESEMHLFDNIQGLFNNVSPDTNPLISSVINMLSEKVGSDIKSKQFAETMLKYAESRDFHFYGSGARVFFQGKLASISLNRTLYQDHLSYIMRISIGSCRLVYSLNEGTLTVIRGNDSNAGSPSVFLLEALESVEKALLSWADIILESENL